MIETHLSFNGPTLRRCRNPEHVLVEDAHVLQTISDRLFGWHPVEYGSQMKENNLSTHVQCFCLPSHLYIGIPIRPCPLCLLIQTVSASSPAHKSKADFFFFFFGGGGGWSHGSKCPPSSMSVARRVRHVQNGGFWRFDVQIPSFLPNRKIISSDGVG